MRVLLLLLCVVVLSFVNGEHERVQRQISEEINESINDGNEETAEIKNESEATSLNESENVSSIKISTRSSGNENTTPKPDKIEKMVKISLYRNEDPDSPFILAPNTLQNAPFDRTRPTKVLIHGWRESGNSLWMLRMKDKHFIVDKYDVIVISWEYAMWEYSLASKKVKKVGKYVAKILNQLIRLKLTSLNNIQIVGHCLGAHVAGIIGKNLNNIFEDKVARITGLDPARSLYEFPILTRARNRLTKDDANLVDVIHTCAGRLGFKRAIGHFDFYPNNGKPPQPGCGALSRYTCSRDRAYHLYTESITSDGFKAKACNSWRSFKKGKCNNRETLIMGLRLNNTQEFSKNVFYLRTNKKEPFSVG